MRFTIKTPLHFFLGTCYDFTNCGNTQLRKIVGSTVTRFHTKKP